MLTSQGALSARATRISPCPRACRACRMLSWLVASLHVYVSNTSPKCHTPISFNLKSILISLNTAHFPTNNLHCQKLIFGQNLTLKLNILQYRSQIKILSSTKLLHIVLTFLLQNISQKIIKRSYVASLK